MSVPRSTRVVEDWFGRFNSGSRSEPVRRFTLSNETTNMSVQVITYGATVTSVLVPDAQGELDDVVLGYDKVEDYYNGRYYFGCTVGRFANRIGQGHFTIDGRQFQLAKNNGPNHLHGGIRGYDKVLWESHVEGSAVTFSYMSPDHEEGYPGSVLNHVSYQLTRDNELIVQYRATASKITPLSLTNHSYFNLAGHGSGDLSEHIVEIYADHFLPVDGNCLPTGVVAPVAGTAFDLRMPSRLGDVLPKLSNGGFDNAFCFSTSVSKQDRKLVARVVHPASGRVMEVFTTQPSLQFYTSNNLPTDDSCVGKGGAIYRRLGAFCMETQSFPDAVNKPNFPDCLVRPGEVYTQSTIYKFSNV